MPDTEYARTPGGRSSSVKFFLAVNSFAELQQKAVTVKDWSGLEGYGNASSLPLILIFESSWRRFL